MTQFCPIMTFRPSGDKRVDCDPACALWNTMHQCCQLALCGAKEVTAKKLIASPKASPKPKSN